MISPEFPGSFIPHPQKTGASPVLLRELGNNSRSSFDNQGIFHYNIFE